MGIFKLGQPETVHVTKTCHLQFTHESPLTQSRDDSKACYLMQPCCTVAVGEANPQCTHQSLRVQTQYEC